ncbi:SusC/RagA family TonB-linked outer membrane protein, partial [Pedobacter sp.]
NANGTFFSNGANPARNLGLLDWKTINKRLIGGVTFELKPIKNLSLKAIGNMDNLDIQDNVFSPAALVNRTRGSASSYPTQIYNRTITGTATYNWSLSKNSKFTFLAGIETQLSDKSLYRNGIFGDADARFDIDRTSYYQAISAGSLTNSLNYYNGFEKDRFSSIFGRINYSYKDKYYLQGVIRRDGSSKFGPDNKYGYFPAVSGSWYINQENFLKNSKVISNLKLRASYGLVGSSNFTAAEYLQKFQFSGSYNGQPVLYPVNIQNPGLKWEEGRNLDLGIDFGLFNGRISGEFSYYRKNTKDALLNGGVSNSTGYSTGWRNVGEIMNEGYELSLNTVNVDTENFKWITRLNASKNFNEVLSLSGLSPDAVGGGTNDTRIAVGYPIGTNYLVRYKGVDPNDGLPIWLDKDGFETKTFSLDNRVPVGKILPDYVGGLTNTFSFKGFELNTLFTFAIGGNLYDGSAKRQLGVVTDWNIREDIADRWRKPGDVAKFPRLTMTPGTYPGLSSEWQYNSTMFLYDATFVRLREVTLSYSFPAKAISKLRLQNLRLFATGMNLLTFSKYPGGDPEIARDFENPQDRNMSPNVTYLTTPQQKSITFGLTTSF